MPKMKLLSKMPLPRDEGGCILSAAATELMDAIQYALWIAAPAGQLVVAIAMVCRRTHREFPTFFAYTAFHVVQAVAGIVIWRHSYSQYFFFYWACEGIDALLSLAVIQEIFSRVFREYESFERLGQILFRWAVMVLISIAVVSAASAPAGDNGLIAGLMVLERSVGFVNCGLLFFLFFFCRYFGLHWRQFVFGIAFGMGIMASILTVSAALQAHFQPSELASRIIPPLAMNIGVGIWVSYALAQERPVTMDGPLPQHNDLRQWNDVLGRMLSR